MAMTCINQQQQQQQHHHQRQQQPLGLSIATAIPPKLQKQQQQPSVQKMQSWSAIAAIGTSAEGKTKTITENRATIHQEARSNSTTRSNPTPRSNPVGAITTATSKLDRATGKDDTVAHNKTTNKSTGSNRCNSSSSTCSMSNTSDTSKKSFSGSSGSSISSSNSSSSSGCSSTIGDSNMNPITRKNPWKIHNISGAVTAIAPGTVSKDSGSIDNKVIGGTAENAPTPAESKDIKVAPLRIKRLLPASILSKCISSPNTHDNANPNSSENITNSKKEKNNEDAASHKQSLSTKIKKNPHSGHHKSSPSKEHSSKQGHGPKASVWKKETGEHEKHQSVRNTTTATVSMASTTPSPSTQQSQPEYTPSKKSQSSNAHAKKGSSAINNNNNNNSANKPLSPSSAKYRQNKDRHSNNHKGTMGKKIHNYNDKKQNEKQRIKTSSNNNNSNKRKKKKHLESQKSNRSYNHTGKLPLTQQQMNKLKPKAVAQVEYFLSTTELAKNVFLRKYMDCCGYVPFAILYNFPSVLSYHMTYSYLLRAVHDLSEKVDVDLVNECVRISIKTITNGKGQVSEQPEQEEMFKKWLFPNADGTLGCPRWIKEPEPVTLTEEISSKDAEVLHVTDNEEEKVDENEGNDSTKQLDLQHEMSSSDAKNSTTIIDKNESSIPERQQQQSTKSKQNQPCNRMPDLAMTDSDTDNTDGDSQ